MQKRQKSMNICVRELHTRATTEFELRIQVMGTIHSYIHAIFHTHCVYVCVFVCADGAVLNCIHMRCTVGMK